jgi:hypothetical protein
MIDSGDMRMFSPFVDPSEQSTENNFVANSEVLEMPFLRVQKVTVN